MTSAYYYKDAGAWTVVVVNGDQKNVVAVRVKKSVANALVASHTFCSGCHRNEERTARGFRAIRLNADRLCAACVDAAAEIAADGGAR